MGDFVSLPSSGGGGVTLLGSSPATKHSSLLGKLVHGASKLGGNLGSDVLHAATGLPAGLEMLAEHPIKSSEAMAHSTWTTWSPLFHGHVGTFAHQTFDHPLAPLLDVASVFTGGAGLAAKLGTKAAEMGLIDEGSTLAKLGHAGEHVYTRPDANLLTGRDQYTKITSTNPAVRLRQDMAHNAMKGLQEHLPKWFGDESFIGQHVVGNAATFERQRLGDMLGRAAGKEGYIHDANAAATLQIGALLKAGKVLSEKDAWPIVHPAILTHNYMQLRRGAREINETDALPKGYGYVSNVGTFRRQVISKAGDSELSNQLRSFGSRDKALTTNVRNAARSGNKVLVAPMHDAAALGGEGANTAKMMMELWRKPTALWKMAVVGYSPKMVVNNAVGNWLMYTMRQGGEHAARGVVDAIRMSKSDKAALHAVKSGNMTAAQYLDRTWVQKFFRDEVNQGFSKSVLASKAGQTPSKLKGGLHPLVHKIADQPVRVAGLHAFMHSAPEVKAIQTAHPGMSFNTAVTHALRNDTTGLRDRAAQHVQTIAGNYTKLSSKERFVQNLIPFYAWDKHIVKHTLNMAVEKPGRLDALAKAGAAGSQAIAGQIGAVPNYMLSELPIGNDNSTGRKIMLDTRGLNPYSSFGDIASAALGDNTAGFSNVAGEMNPIAATLAKLLSQNPSDAASNTQSKGQGLAGLVASGLGGSFSNIPELTLLNEALHGTQDTRTTPSGQVKPLLHEKNLRDSLLTYLAGVPIKRTDLAHAHQLAAGKKKKQAYTLLG